MKVKTWSIGGWFIAVSVVIIGIFVSAAIADTILSHSLQPFATAMGNGIGKVEVEWLRYFLSIISFVAILLVNTGIQLFSVCATIWIFVSVGETLGKCLDFIKEGRVKPSEKVGPSH